MPCLSRSPFAHVALISFLLFSSSARSEDISPSAQRVVSTIDALDVEHHWPAGAHVRWETGEPDGKPESNIGRHTHCSAFAAAAAKALGIYLLRPPEHKQILLANAQFDWLESEGVAHGWRPVLDALEAQALANRGELVVATYKNHHDDKPGHIAIVRPSTKSEAAIRRDGPEITQAGETNYRQTTLSTGFSGHPAAWAHHEVRFYAHAVKSLPVQVH